MVGGSERALWWGVPVIAGGFLVLGAVLGYWFNRLQDERKFKRDSNHRWDEDVLQHTSEVIALSDAFKDEAVGCIIKLTLRRKEVGSDDPMRLTLPWEERKVLFPKYEPLTAECTALRLVAPEQVRVAVVTLATEARTLLSSFSTVGAWPDTDRLSDAVEELESAVRRHFDIK